MSADSPYTFADHTADIQMRVRGDDLPALFRNAAAGLYAVIGELVVASDGGAHTIELQANSRDELLRDWLAELLFLFETRHQILDAIAIDELTGDRLRARGAMKGIDMKASGFDREIKAVTYHELAVRRLDDGSFRAEVILDI